jgi:hypothetical protein
MGKASPLGQVLSIVSAPLARESIFLPLFCILSLLDQSYVERELATRLINIFIHFYVSFRYLSKLRPYPASAKPFRVCSWFVWV